MLSSDLRKVRINLPFSPLTCLGGGGASGGGGGGGGGIEEDVNLVPANIQKIKKFSRNRLDVLFWNALPKNFAPWSQF